MDESLNARRAQLLVDGELQGTLVRRVIYYWLTAILSLAIAILIAKAIWGEPFTWKRMAEAFQLLGPACALALIPLPFIVRDLLTVTHRFAGPMLRIRRGLSELAENGETSAIVARSGDAWSDCIADFNQIAQRFQESPRVRGVQIGPPPPGAHQGEG
jgi:hypothetical protein